MERRDKDSRAAAQQESIRQFKILKRQQQQQTALLNPYLATEQVTPLHEIETEKPEGAGWVVWFTLFGFGVSSLALWKIVEIVIWVANKWHL